MPYYEYLCKSCNTTHEIEHRITEKKRKCPKCKALKLERQIVATNFTLKGTGWYVTDYRNKK